MTTTTYAKAISDAEQVAQRAKRAALIAREASKAKPGDAVLRAAAANAADEAAEAGREVARWQFEEALDVWIDRHSRFEVVADENLMSLAPRTRGVVDWYWLAAAHCARSGMKVPRGWRSPDTGEAFNDNFGTN